MRHRFRQLATCASLAAALAACETAVGVVPPAGDAPTIAVVTTSVAPGALVELRTSNADDRTWGYPSPCNTAIERLQGGVWVTVQDSRLGVCIGVVYTVAPGVVEARQLPAPAQDGTYRIRAYWTLPTGGETSTLSNAFEVRGDGDVRLFAMNAPIAAGASLTVRVVNTTTFTWGYNTCAWGRFQRRVGDAWTSTGEPLWLCTAQLDPLGPAAMIEIPVTVPAEFAAGTYRFTQRFTRTDAAVVAATAAFTVE